ncbi:MAG: S-adenosylmethionine decarboxylase [Candidatus Woesearchaeota archaeon]
MKGDGIHLNLGKCKINIADNPAQLKKVINHLVKLTGLKKLGRGDVQVGASYLPGASVCQIIETSHIAIHGFSINSCYDVTIVSCAPFSSRKVISYLRKTLKPTSMRSQLFKVDTIYRVTK